MLLIFSVVFFRLLFDFLLAVVLIVPRFTATDYPFVILDLRLLITPFAIFKFSYTPLRC